MSGGGIHRGFVTAVVIGRPAPLSGWGMEQLGSKFLREGGAPDPLVTLEVWGRVTSAPVVSGRLVSGSGIHSGGSAQLHAWGCTCMHSLGVGVDRLALNYAPSSDRSGEGVGIDAAPPLLRGY